MQSNEEQQNQLEGLLVVEAYQDEDATVDIYTVRSGELVLLESGGELFARTWLCHHARRLVSWKPRRLHDELSGIWRRLSSGFPDVSRATYFLRQRREQELNSEKRLGL